MLLLLVLLEQPFTCGKVPDSLNQTQITIYPLLSKNSDSFIVFSQAAVGTIWLYLLLTHVLIINTNIFSQKNVSLRLALA